MTERELEQILISIERALAVYWLHSGRLSAADISTRSMLSVVRRNVAEELHRVRHAPPDVLPGER